MANPQNIAGACLEWALNQRILDTYLVKAISGGAGRHFAQGGMGRVYRLFHQGWGIDLAAKVPLKAYLDDAGTQEAFLNECQAWVDLALNPYVVSCHYIRHVDDVPVVFAEFIPGGTLHQWISEGRLYRGSPDEILKRILDIAIQTAWGLHHAHQQDLVHQDVKPLNIMMTGEGIAKITDFGFAKLREGILTDGRARRSSLDGASATREGLTRPYCSPEQLEPGLSPGRPGPPKLTRHTDMWSWAVSVLEMFNGGIGWTYGIEAPAQLAQIKMPAQVKNLLNICFAFRPADRYKDMAEVAVELRNIYRELTGQEHPREIPRMLTLRADNLNNKAISFLDLGNETAAYRFLNQALQIDRLHLEASYNLGLLQWRNGACTDKSLLTQFGEIGKQRPDDARPLALTGLVHAERGDRNSAIAALEEASANTITDLAISETLAGLNGLPPHAGQRLRTMNDHSALVSGVVISSDGKYLVSGSWDHTLRVWKLPAMECVHVLTGHTGHVVDIAVSANSGLVISGGEDQVIRVWDINEGSCVRCIKEAHGKIWSVAISPDGKTGVVGTDGNNAWIYDLQAGRCTGALEGHNGLVIRARFTAGGDRVVTASWDETMVNWDFSRRKPIRLYELHNGKLEDVVLSPDGQQALIACENTTIRLLDLETGKEVQAFRGHGGAVSALTLSADGQRALSVSSTDNTLRIWDVRTGRCIRTFENDRDFAHAVAVTPDGRTAYTGGNTLREWDLSEGHPAFFALSRPKAAAALTAAESTYQSKVVQAGRAIEKNEIGQALRLIAEARGIADFSRAHKILDILAAAGRRCRRKQVSAAFSTEIHLNNKVLPSCMAIEPDDREAAIYGHMPLNLAVKEQVRTKDDFMRTGIVGFSNGEVVLVDLRKQILLAALENQHTPIEMISYLRGGRRCVISGRFKPAHVYDLVKGNRLEDELWKAERDQEQPADWCTGRPLIHPDNAVSLHTGFFECTATSWDKKLQLLCSGERNRLCQKDLVTGREFPLDAGDFVDCVAILPDRRFGFSGGGDGVIRVWELTTRQCIYQLEGHKAAIASLACSPDGRWVMTAGKDCTLRIWELVWDYEFPGWADDMTAADDIIKYLLKKYGIRDKKDWNREIYYRLMLDMQCGGYGWYAPERVMGRISRLLSTA